MVYIYIYTPWSIYLKKRDSPSSTEPMLASPSTMKHGWGDTSGAVAMAAISSIHAFTGKWVRVAGVGF